MKGVNDQSLEWTLVRRSLTEELTEEEKQQLNTWLNASPVHQAYYDRISGFNPAEGIPGLSKEQYERDFTLYVSLIRQAKQQQKRRRLVYFTRYAAVLIVLLAVGVYFWYQETSVSEIPATSLSLAVQGKPQPILVTEEGTRVLLDEQGDSLRQISHEIISSGKNGIVYNNVSQGTTPAVVGHHTLIIPRGGEFRVELADGTIVWLNSETEFSYPVSFADSTREVTLKGEAYFEVVKSAKAFKVRVEDVVVKVYGTHFNVNSYDKERVQTVLLSGKVGVSSLKHPAVEQMIKPNEMADVNVLTGICEVKTVDAVAYAAWKDGYFSFEHETLEQIMEKLSRWYDVQVTFKNDEARMYRFSGRISRDKDFQGVLNLLARTFLVKFDVDGNEIIIN